MSHNPLLQTILRVRQSGRVALCGYFLTGYQTPELFYQAVRAANGLDIIEFGIPSSNPYLDGETIEAAHKTVVEQRGVQTETSLALIGGLKNVVQPRFVMTYARDGRELQGFFRLCVENHIHGVLAPDISLEESAEVAKIAASLNLAYVSFIHTGMNEGEILARAAQSQIVYLKLSTGATGSYAHMEKSCGQLRSVISLLRSHYPTLLIAAGVGIQQPQQIVECGSIGADMVIVGTVLMHKMQSSLEELSCCIDEFHRATQLNTSVSKAVLTLPS